MYKYLGFLILPFFLGCNKYHNIPEAELSYIDIRQEKEGIELYTVKFSSNMDLLHIFDRNQSPLGSWLNCSLEQDDSLQNLESAKYIASGLLSDTPTQQVNSNFVFFAELSFDENLKGGYKTRKLEKGELKKILSAKQAIPCINKANNFGYRPYFSGVLWIPTADILREVEN